MDNMLSASDVALLQGDNRTTDRDEFIWIFALLILFGGGNFGGFGNNANNGALTRAEMQAGFDAQTAQIQNMGITNGLYNGFYGQNTTMLTGFNNIGTQVSDARFASEKCCCETNRNIDSLRFQGEKNTCDLIQAGNANTQRIIDVIENNEKQKLRDDLQTAKLQLSEQMQTKNIVEAVRPFPQPAYITCSPYTSNNGCGCGPYVGNYY